MKRAGWPAAAAAGLALAAASCAPPPPGAVTAGTWRERYLAGLDRRAAAASALEASVALWLKPASGRRVPGVLGTLEIAAPDRFRLTVNDPVGTALQAGGDGRHVTLVLPARRAGFESDAVGDSLGLDRPSWFLVGAMAALWQPTRAAWTDPDSGGAARTATWSEAGAKIALDVDARGRPLAVRVTTERMSTLRIGYADWFKSLGAEWPRRIEIEDSAGGGRLRCLIERLRRRGSDRALGVTIPRGARTLDWAGLKRELSERGGS